MRIIGDGGHASVVRDVLQFVGYKYEKDDIAFVAIGDNESRKREADILAEQGFPFAILQHHFSTFAHTASAGPGTIIMAGAVVQPNVRIGKHCIINTGATIDHDCVIGDYVHIAPGAHLCGGVEVGEGALIGVGVGIEPGTKIPPWSIVKRERYTICPTK